MTNYLSRCASDLLRQEAGKITRQQLWEEISNPAGRVQKRVPPIFKQNATPSEQDCRDALTQEAKRLRTKAKQTESSAHLQDAALLARYDAIYARVSALNYLTSLQFLEEFDGKRLLFAFLQLLNADLGIQLSKKRFIKEVADALPQLHQTHPGLYSPDDFRELANGVRALAGLLPV